MPPRRRRVTLDSQWTPASLSPAVYLDDCSPVSLRADSAFAGPATVGGSLGGWVMPGLTRTASAAGAARPTLQTDGIQFDSAIPNSLSLSSSLTLSADFSIYAVGTRATSKSMVPLGGSVTDTCVMIFEDNKVYIVTTGGFLGPDYTGSAGLIAARWTRDASNNVRFAATGMDDMSMGAPLGGNLILDTVGARPLSTQYSASKFDFVVASGRKLTADEDAKMRAIILRKYRVVLPAATAA